MNDKKQNKDTANQLSIVLAAIEKNNKAIQNKLAEGKGLSDKEIRETCNAVNFLLEVLNAAQALYSSAQTEEVKP
jgi:hypothetical protein